MSTQESCQPFTGMLPSDANAAFLQSEGNGSHGHTAPLTSQWALPMQAPVTAAGQQTMYQVPQSVVQVEPPKEPGSAHKRIDVTSDGASSARQMSSRREQWKDLPGFQIRMKNKISKAYRNAMTSMNEVDLTVWHTFYQLMLQLQNGRAQYYCDQCGIWVLVHRKKFHDKKHNAGEFVCKICEVLKEPCEPLSRKDSLKRHIEVKHPMFVELLRSCSLRLLVPRRKNEREREDLDPLFQAMINCIT
ncbi:hypothetical protein JVT61DRAFT_10566 [Boletus reticuloceps]|uniref:Uncharacterized protein n=1 Tax=Boletus reticuloceps TaxID=495285 RepID=A0A8I2YT87_9AGAM|nr:hypothetical protein JVT61DRAFT_15442 [Boletus reticuloceps]KAG6379991.1 hypothetical protein JVT61DRAFT_10566 [Boletus reticuloceps]